MLVCHTNLLGSWKTAFIEGWQSALPDDEHIVVELVDLGLAIATRKPRLVVAHGYTLPAPDFHRLAVAYPDVRFLHWSHAPLSRYALSSGATDLLAVVAKCENAHFAMPEAGSALDLLGLPRVLHAPCPTRLQEPSAPALHNPPVVLLSCRPHEMKGLSSAVVAMRLLQQRRPITAAIGVGNGHLLRFARQIGLKCATWQWSPTPEAWFQRLRQDVDVLLQPSMAETHNYLGLEAAMVGVPVVASRALRYCPSHLQCEPCDPKGIADAAENILDSYPAESAAAVEHAARYVTACNRLFAERIGALVAAD